MSRNCTRIDLLDRGIQGLLTLFALERFLKLSAVAHFFSQSPPPDPFPWPVVSLIQPVTRGASGLQHNLQTRAKLDYPALVQHLLVCDAQDHETQTICHNYIKSQPALQADLLLIETDHPPVASKIEKMLTALPHAHGEVLCFLDDDIALRTDALRLLVSSLQQTNAGAVFGLACYTNWETPWASLMSLFVNTHALLSYVPLTYLIEPFTITGHCFALKRSTFEQAGGFAQLDGRIDDDHELARRVRKIGLRCVQTPLIYDVNNELPSLSVYLLQMKRWFVLPRQTMLPYLSLKEQFVSLISSFGNLLPGLLLLSALVTRRRSAVQSVSLSLALSGAIYAFCEQHYMHHKTPLKGWILLPCATLLTPFLALAALLTNNEIEWRGQRLSIRRGGMIAVLPARGQDFYVHDKD